MRKHRISLETEVSLKVKRSVMVRVTFGEHDAAMVSTCVGTQTKPGYVDEDEDETLDTAQRCLSPTKVSFNLSECRELHPHLAPTISLPHLTGRLPV